MAIATRSTAHRIESLLSARLFLSPQLADDRLYFVSDLAGRLSLYAMDAAGSVPEPLLPPGIALQNPELVGGHLFYVLPDHGRILLMLDHDGDENYEPSMIPLEGGFPEPLNGDAYGAFPVAYTRDHTRAVLGDGYTAGDVVLYEHDPDSGERRMIWGVPIEDRVEGEEQPPSGIQTVQFTSSGRGLLVSTSLFDDAYGPGYLDLARPGEIEPVALDGIA